ncbi:MAG: MarR family transcriptional regulator [Candidatus Marinimicrobia bacterium]|nr:MarR family transcriptional regulator [Candidatus Neomarinimicrobiota bacterium]
MKKNRIHHPSIGRLLGMINHQGNIYFMHAFKDIPIGHAQIFTLHHLIHHDGISQKHLTKYTKLDKSSIASQLHYLEKNGYLYRKQSPDDARVLNIYVTEKTRSMEKELNEIFQNWSRILLNGFDEDEQKEVQFILLRMLENAQLKIKEIKNEK